MAKIRVIAQILEPNVTSFKKGRISSDDPLILNIGSRAYFVTKLFPRTYRNPFTLGLTKKTVLHATVMKGEPRALSYMDTFDSERFERFLDDTLKSLTDSEKEAETAKQALMEWTGIDVEIEGLAAEPWLLRRFRASPVTDEHFFRAISDSQRAKLMRGKKTPEILWFFLGLIVGGVMVGISAYTAGDI